jgi:hypothetical protein
MSELSLSPHYRYVIVVVVIMKSCVLHKRARFYVHVYDVVI